jgi:hypothetical protein
MSEETPKSQETRPAATDSVSSHPQDSPVDRAASDSRAHGHGHAHLPHVVGEFLERLKRRNVGRVAILYSVVCYVILEPFEMFFHLLELPAWTGRTVVFLMVLGFPAALLFAWIYEITPEGIKPAAQVDPGQSIARHTGRKLDFANRGQTSWTYTVEFQMPGSEHLTVFDFAAVGSWLRPPKPAFKEGDSVAIHYREQWPSLAVIDALVK